MPDIAALTARNTARFDKARITRGPEFAAVAKRLVAAKSRYQAVSERTGVPWFVIAVIHEREASQDWNTQLGQGDPLNQVSRHDPKGRGPFNTWEDGAYDALVLCPPFATKWKDWSPGGTMTLLESYNGFGYANKGIPSPYVWSGTDQYVSGKYVADHVFDPAVVDKQLGCAGLILAMRALDASIFPATTVQPPDVEPPVPLPKPKPSIVKKTGGAVAAGSASAAAAHQAGWPVGYIVAAAVVAAIVIFLIIHFTRKD